MTHSRKKSLANHFTNDLKSFKIETRNCVRNQSTVAPVTHHLYVLQALLFLPDRNVRHAQLFSINESEHLKIRIAETN